MPDIILPDTSTLIFLQKIGEIDLLKNMYKRTIITKEVADEYIISLEKWIEIAEPKEKHKQKILEQFVDKGEASLMVLALKIENSIISLDDLRARKIANKMGLAITGTLGILIKAKKSGHIRSIKESISKLKENDFRISEDIEKEMIILSGE